MEDGERELAAQLLDRAADDVAAASALLEAADVRMRSSDSDAQQAVEKAIKAVLRSRGTDYPFTHDLESLSRRRSRVRVPSLPQPEWLVVGWLSGLRAHRIRARGGLRRMGS